MAKQHVFKGNIKNFSDVNKFLAEIDGGQNAGLSTDYREIETTKWVHSGNYLYNAHISGSLRRGVSTNRVITIAGDPKAGKSYLILNMMRELIDEGYFFYYFETEGALERERLILHLGPERMKQVRVAQFESIKDLTILCMKVSESLMKMKKEKKEIPKIGLAVDSYTGLNANKVIQDALEGNKTTDMGNKAKELTEFFNLMVLRASKLDMPILGTAHIREEQVNNFKLKKVKGGLAPLYMSSVVVVLSKKFEYSTDEKVKTKQGIHVISDIIESRYSRPNKVSFYLPFDRPMNPYVGLEKYFSWDICGIDKGKFVDLVDIADELLKKKFIEKSNFTTKKVKLSEIKEKIAKSKEDAIVPSVEYMIENGYITIVGDEQYTFTDKTKANFSDAGYTPIEDKVAIVNRNIHQWIVKHLKRSVTHQELFSSLAITDEVLEAIDKHIEPEFNFGKNNGEPTVQGETGDDSLDDFYSSDNEE